MLLANLKNSFNSIKKNPFNFIFSFILMPLVLAIVLFKSQSAMMSGEIEVRPLSIAIVDEDKSSYSEIISEYFKTVESEKYFILSEESDYLIRIPKGFEENIIDNSKIDLTIETIGNDTSVYDVELINSYLDTLGKAILKSKDKNVILSSISDEDKKLEVLNALNYIESDIEIGQENILKEEKIPFNEHNGITMIQYIFVSFLVSSAVGSKKLADTTGLPMRMGTLPVDKFKLQITEIITNTLTLFIFSSIYIVICNAIDMGFSKNLGLNILIALSISLTSSIFIQFLDNIKREISVVIVYIILYGQLVFGGMIGPVNKLFENTILERFMGINLNSIFINPFMDVGNEIFTKTSLLPGIVVGIVSFTLMYGIIKIKKLRRER